MSKKYKKIICNEETHVTIFNNIDGTMCPPEVRMGYLARNGRPERLNNSVLHQKEIMPGKHDSFWLNKGTKIWVGCDEDAAMHCVTNDGMKPDGSTFTELIINVVFE